MATEAAAGTTTTGWRRNAIGLREALFQSITDIAPGAATAASIPAGVAFAGGSLPLAASGQGRLVHTGPLAAYPDE
jgi:hypothetical protein